MMRNDEAVPCFGLNVELCNILILNDLVISAWSVFHNSLNTFNGS